jgi:hypothetical protein
LAPSNSSWPAAFRPSERIVSSTSTGQSTQELPG